jgi:predicted nucleic acid-binding protein
MMLSCGPVTTLFLDANVLISAAWKDGSEIALIWRMEGVRLITSNYVMGEVQRNLHQVSQIERLRALMRSVQIVSFEELPAIPEATELPEKDRPVLVGAVQAQADHLVSGDKRHFGHLYGTIVRGVRITAPTELLTVLRLRLP